MQTNPGEREADEVLVRRLRRGDGDAFAALATRYWGALHRIGRNMLPDPSMAEDLAEATLLTALRSPNALPADVPFRTALYRQAMRYSLDFLFPVPSNVARSLARYLPRFDAQGRLTSAGRDWTERGAGGGWPPDLEARIREILQRLDALDRASYVLCVVEQLPTLETAAILEIARESVVQRTHRASLILTGFLTQLFTRTGALDVPS